MPFLLRELWRHLWKKQAVLRRKKEVSQHWYNHCTELRLPRTSESLPYHFCTRSRPQLWLPGECRIYARWEGIYDACTLCPFFFAFNLWFSFFSLAASMTLDLSAHQGNPKAKTRRRRAIISCMQGLHLETSLTTTSSPSAAFATSARCWKKRGTTASSVRFTVSVGSRASILTRDPG